ncbi:MAG: hypothetical protein HC892_15775 [Saprospiraceae bacterium]|nr:hypothetical protein [Saprospiraceae bacterium]
MKTKLVLWGKNAQEERVLLGIELKPESNLVKTYIFSEAVATDDFANALMQNWRDGKEMEMPEGHTQIELPLSVTDNIIPEDLTLERPDLLTRAQTEWHFVVLSSKLHDVYRSELEDFRDKIGKLQQYDAKMWDQLKGFWQKVHGQIKEQNLFREHADSLQNTTNQLFEELKKLRTKIEEQFQLRSRELMQQFMDKLSDIEKRASEGARLSTAFEDLKTLQTKFKDAKFTKEHRTEVWNRLDSAFKAVKEKRFGAEAAQQDNSAEGRFDRRLDGLGQAMDRMENPFSAIMKT